MNPSLRDVLHVFFQFSPSILPWKWKEVEEAARSHTPTWQGCSWKDISENRQCWSRISEQGSGVLKHSPNLVEKPFKWEEDFQLWFTIYSRNMKPFLTTKNSSPLQPLHFWRKTKPTCVYVAKTLRGNRLPAYIINRQTQHICQGCLV